ncbi:unnamed protein product [Adineta steineri]|uniref:B30.2/SPRY domain-containing protein n=1 Tax=Adineta steineri TaxID=433720 RepID=A0A813W6F5_9BILA|nr:unnamed protein product [Adineta steineri]CAF3988950.1 unnamed protein product [Adineta steineri]
MASPASPKISCSICAKSISHFTCRGCQKGFCMCHANEHRQQLSEQIDELALQHDQLRNNLTEQLKETDNHPLIKQIYEWEQNSINKIQKTATIIRTQLQIIISKHIENLSVDLTKFTNELNQAREVDDYFETELNEWMKKLDILKDNLFKPKVIEINLADNNIPLISKPLISMFSEEIIEKIVGNIRIEDNGQTIIHNHHQNCHATARGSNEYTWGQHRFRLKLENINTNKWIFIGIINKDTSMKETSHKSLSTYGWAPPDQVYLNGALHTGYKNYNSDIELNDIMMFTIDCDRQKISLTNERTRSTWVIDIDLNKCPYPWQLHFNLHNANDRIRILSI